MCYPKPGPRCSAHAEATLVKKRAAYLADPNFDNYAAMRDAEKEYEITPAGQRFLQDKIDAETDLESKYDLTVRLRYAQEARQEALKAIQAKDSGDVDEDHEDEVSALPFPQDPLPVSAFSAPPKVGEYGTGFIYGGGIDIDYDSYDCADPDCAGNYCHDKVYSGLRIDKVDTREFIATAMHVDSEKVPPEWVQTMENVGLESNVEVEAQWAYYGEMVGVVVSDEVAGKMQDLYYSQPNNHDDQGGYSYAREEGLDTSNKRPLEALLATVNTDRLPKKLARQVERSFMFTKESVRVSNITVLDEKDVDSAEGFDFSKLPKGIKPSGGVLIPNGPKKYILVGGDKRFNAVRKKGNVFWNFHVLA